MSLHLSKCQIVGNLMPRLKFTFIIIALRPDQNFSVLGCLYSTHEHLTISQRAGSPDSVRPTPLPINSARPGTEFWSTEFEKDDEGCDEIAVSMSVCKNNCEYHARCRLLLVTDKVIR